MRYKKVYQNKVVGKGGFSRKMIKHDASLELFYFSYLYDYSLNEISELISSL